MECFDIKYWIRLPRFFGVFEQKNDKKFQRINATISAVNEYTQNTLTLCGVLWRWGEKWGVPWRPEILKAAAFD